MARPTERGLAVFDLDGTLADVRHRLRYVESAPRDWRAFFRAAPRDPPLPEGVELALRWAEECDLGYVTGRPERCRRDTERWLERQGLPAGRLRMRGDADRRPARTVKPELLRGLAGRERVAVVVDDDPRVCDAYRAAGYRVLHADWSARSATLERAQEERGRT
ncbi:hypothetical protein E0L36_15260 [Streptomyces sp. AJS327]|uniref:phosphatase domain-containing protein n=1 Tax=Streptomyces sp. AJS327 TaxID=2545265 RepID=UPI0015DDFB69|nr:hypothetical protein [Streptomyces sp. AJS327]MBA0052212.1 hypothetical protein [Streptomyces sp. AJS327]